MCTKMRRSSKRFRLLHIYINANINPDTAIIIIVTITTALGKDFCVILPESLTACILALVCSSSYYSTSCHAFFSTLDSSLCKYMTHDFGEKPELLKCQGNIQHMPWHASHSGAFICFNFQNNDAYFYQKNVQLNAV